jgi:hypothetical protein
MDVFAITTNDNDKTRDCDIVFKPAAARVRDAYNAGYATFSNAEPYPKNRDDLLKKIRDISSSLDMFAYFGHGWHNPPQLGGHVINDEDIKMLARELAPKMRNGASIVFYSCLVGSANGLTTKVLNTVGKGVWVYGHTTVEHSFKNAAVSEVHDGSGLRFRMLPNIYGPTLSSAWSIALSHSDLWLRFPLMQHVDIMKELNAIRLVGTWSVPGGKKYVFEWPITNGTYSTEESLCVNPNGPVKDTTSGKTGSWELDDDLYISWGTTDREKWSMPINPDGQPVQGASGLAKRTARGAFGIPQG